MKLGKSLLHTMQLRRIIGYLQKLLYTFKRIRMSPTPTLNIYLFEGPILSNCSKSVGYKKKKKLKVVFIQPYDK
jgi:hypothetical protein